MSAGAAGIGIGRSLHARLSILLLVLLAALGGLSVLGILRLSRLYQMEVAQSLNRDLARQIALSEREALLGSEGRFEKERLAELFHWLMVVNPSVEFYVLDTEGNVLGYDAPPGVVKRTKVDLAPVDAFLRRTAPLPILGDDPRDPVERKVFSASPLPLEGAPRGYLYVILAGEQVDSVAQMLGGSYVLRAGLATAAAYVALAADVGLLAFRRLTRPLRALEARMRAFQERQRIGSLPAVSAGDDEVRRLERAFDEMASRIEAQMAEIRRTEELRRELVANVSHDLRTPLASLQGYLETLVMKSRALGEAEREGHLRTALRQGEQLGRLVDDLFELAKLEADVDQPRPEPFSLAELVQDTVQDQQARAAASGVTLGACVDAEPSVVRADIGMVQRVLQNLVDNAFGAVRAKGSGGGRIDVRLIREPGVVGVEVEDDGCGIPASDLPRVFDRLFRGSGARERDGSGLGLAIGKRIAELHGGTLTVESVEGEGSRFRFRLPA